MSRIFALTLAATAVLALATGAGLALAQDSPNSSTDANATNDEPSEFIFELGDVRVVDAEWGDSARVTLENTGDFSQTVSITDVSPLNGDAGGAQVDTRDVRVRGGETVTIEIALADPSNPQLSLSSDGNAGLLEGDSGSFNPFSGVAATWGFVRIATASAGGGAAICVGLVGWSAVADRHDSEELVDP